MFTSEYFDQFVNRTQTDSIKWNKTKADGTAVSNPMWIADMDFACPPAVVEAMVKRASHPIYGYTEQNNESKDAFVQFMKRRHNLTITQDDVILLPCVITGLLVAINCFSEKGDGVIYQSPVYGPFSGSIQKQGRTPISCPLIKDENNNYTMDFNSIEEACKNGAKMMLLCNPHNPVGRAWTEEELSTLYTLLKRYNVFLVSDEIHQDFIMPSHKFTSMLSFVTDEKEKVITLTSASKTFNLAGLHQAMLISKDPEARNNVTTHLDATGTMAANIFGLVATQAAYEKGDEWLDGLLAYINLGYKKLCDAIATNLPKAIVSPLESTYLAWIDLNAYGLSTQQIIERTLENGVALTPGTDFGVEGEGFIRLNMACPHSRIIDTIVALKNAISK